MVKIVLDPGHGGKDSGAVGNGIQEKDITLNIVKKIEAKLRGYKNVEIMLTRTDDTFHSLQERTDKANKWSADVFLSVHVNSATVVTAKGFETFTYPQADSKTKSFQNVLHEEVMKQISGIVDRGKKQSNFHVLRETNMTALLSENLFINNSIDAAKLKDNGFLDKIAYGHTSGLVRFFGLQLAEDPKQVTSPLAKSPTAEQEQALFQVICGTFNDITNATRQVEKLKALGYDSYIKKKD